MGLGAPRPDPLCARPRGTPAAWLLLGHPCQDPGVLRKPREAGATERGGSVPSHLHIGLRLKTKLSDFRTFHSGKNNRTWGKTCRHFSKSSRRFNDVPKAPGVDRLRAATRRRRRPGRSGTKTSSPSPAPTERPPGTRTRAPSPQAGAEVQSGPRRPSLGPRSPSVKQGLPQPRGQRGRAMRRGWTEGRSKCLAVPPTPAGRPELRQPPRPGAGPEPGGRGSPGCRRQPGRRPAATGCERS